MPPTVTLSAPPSTVAAAARGGASSRPVQPRPLYTAAERARRDRTWWTPVQGVLAPIQLLACLASVVLVARYLAHGGDATWASASVIVKTGLLYLIMITGCCWEKAVFGRWLFAPAFWWKDFVSMGVLALHTAWLLAWWFDWGSPTQRMVLALVAYGAYGVNAAQFLLKLRAARRDRQVDADDSAPLTGVSR